MSHKAYFPFFPGDYDRDTRDLTMLQHGAYFALLRHLYSTEKEIADEKTAFRIAGATKKTEKEAVKFILNRFFIQNSEGFSNKKAAEIIKERAAKSAKAKKSADSRWNANASNSHMLPEPDPEPYPEPEILKQHNKNTYKADASVCDEGGRVVYNEIDEASKKGKGKPSCHKTASENKLSEIDIKQTPSLNPESASHDSKDYPFSEVISGGSLPGFEKFWAVYPSHRKKNRNEALEGWVSQKLEGQTEAILKGLEAKKKTDQWTKEVGQYIPQAVKFLSERQWVGHGQPKPDKAESIKQAWRERKTLFNPFDKAVPASDLIPVDAGYQKVSIEVATNLQVRDGNAVPLEQWSIVQSA